MDMNYFNYVLSEEDAKELRSFFYDGGLLSALHKLILVKHFTNVELLSETYDVKKFGGEDGVSFRLRITTDENVTNTIEFRFFLWNVIPPTCFTLIDRKAGLVGKQLSRTQSVELRILWVVFEQIKFFSLQSNASTVCNKRTRVATVWTQNPSGHIGRQGVIN